MDCCADFRTASARGQKRMIRARRESGWAVHGAGWAFLNPFGRSPMGNVITIRGLIARSKCKFPTSSAPPGKRAWPITYPRRTIRSIAAGFKSRQCAILTRPREP